MLVGVFGGICPNQLRLVGARGPRVRGFSFLAPIAMDFGDVCKIGIDLKLKS
jgi:hypothetical protein